MVLIELYIQNLTASLALTTTKEEAELPTLETIGLKPSHI